MSTQSHRRRRAAEVEEFSRLVRRVANDKSFRSSVLSPTQSMYTLPDLYLALMRPSVVGGQRLEYINSALGRAVKRALPDTETREVVRSGYKVKSYVMFGDTKFLPLPGEKGISQIYDSMEDLEFWEKLKLEYEMIGAVETFNDLYTGHVAAKKEEAIETPTAYYQTFYKYLSRLFTNEAFRKRALSMKQSLYTIPDLYLALMRPYIVGRKRPKYSMSFGRALVHALKTQGPRHPDTGEVVSRLVKRPKADATAYVIYGDPTIIAREKERTPTKVYNATEDKDFWRSVRTNYKKAGLVDVFDNLYTGITGSELRTHIVKQRKKAAKSIWEASLQPHDNFNPKRFYIPIPKEGDSYGRREWKVKIKERLQSIKPLPILDWDLTPPSRLQ